MIPLSNMTVQSIFIGVATLITLANVFSAVLMWRIGATFASRDDLEDVKKELGGRLEAIEATAESLEARVRNAEVNVGATAAEIKGIRDLVGRIDHMVGLLVEYRIRETAHE